MAMMTAARHFTVEEADSLIPALELHFGRVTQLRTQMRVVYEELESLGARPVDGQRVEVSGTPAAASGSDAVGAAADAAVSAARGRFRVLAEAIGDEISLIEELGGAVKDLELGTVDFLGEIAGEEVWLCWQYGEKRIDFFHPLDVGFSGRRPIRPRSRDRATLLH